MPLTAQIAVTHRPLATIDIAIIAFYFVAIFAIGFYFSRKERTSEDYFLAGRNVGWFAIGASLFVSNISTEHFIGLAGSGATSGLAVGHRHYGGARLAMGALHQVAQLAALRLPAKRAGLYQPADCGVLHLRDPLDAPKRAGRDQHAADGICDGDDPFRPGGHG
jgi:hypothetical protein